jgi:O-antigen/teichoic acid export membrane protein
MSTKTKTGVRKGAAFLGAAGLIEYGLQVVLPIILVRTLTPEAFGDYRLVWLLAITAVGIFPLAMPQSLFHFLPQAGSVERQQLVGNAWLFVTLSGLTAAVLLSLSWSLLPASVAGLQRYSLLAPAFLLLWVMSSLIDVLPTADGNARWQAVAITALAVLRALALGLTAVLTRDVGLVLLVMCAFALIKTLLVPLYAWTAASSRGLAIQLPLLVRQVRYAAPFAVGIALFLLRVQADQWLVAAYFPPEVFALISIAAIVLSISTLIRQPLNNATLPRLSHLIGSGELAGARELLAKSYSALALILFPVLGLLYVLSREIVEIVYTPRYLGAAPLMQLYLLGQMTMVFAAGHLLVVLNAGRVATTISAVCLALSVTLSLAGIHLIGLAGAVAGSVLSLVIGEVWALLTVTRHLETTVAGIMHWRIIGRALGVVATAIIGTSLAREYGLAALDLWGRLVTTGAVFLLVLSAGTVATGLHRSILPILAGLPQRA